MLNFKTTFLSAALLVSTPAHSHTSHQSGIGPDDLAIARDSAILTVRFDHKINSIQTPEEMDALFASPLYCQIQAAKSLFEDVEARWTKSLSQPKTTAVSGLGIVGVHELARQDKATQRALNNLVLFWEQSQQGCQEKDCLGKELKEALTQTLAQQKEQLQDLTDLKVQKLTVEETGCADSTGSVSGDEATSAAGFDWSRRNWIRDNTEVGEFVVTYDDGPHKERTIKIMDLWEQSRLAKPAFFWLSQNVKRYPEIVREVHDRGFVIGSHSLSHGDLGNLARARSKSDLNSTNRSHYARELKKVTNFSSFREAVLDREILGSAQTIEETVQKFDQSFRLQHFRLPYGSGVRNDKIGGRFARADVDHFFWAVDSLDWSDPNPASIMSRVRQQMRIQKRGLVLFHDIHERTVAATRLLIDEFKQSRQVVPVSIRKMR